MGELRQIEGQHLKERITSLAKQWSQGKVSLKQIVGLSDEELYAISSQGYLIFLQGRTKQAQVIFEGLVAVDPRNSYYYHALGSIYWRLGEPNKALKQFTYAMRVSPRNILSYVNRAEVYVSEQDFPSARKDLQHAISRGRSHEQPLINKARAMMRMIAP